jgi:hypothetical protein
VPKHDPEDGVPDEQLELAKDIDPREARAKGSASDARARIARARSARVVRARVAHDAGHGRTAEVYVCKAHQYVGRR